jgi:hypothetical protein
LLQVSLGAAGHMAATMNGGNLHRTLSQSSAGFHVNPRAKV